MSDTTNTPVIKIDNAAEFRTVAKKYGVAFGERGRLPMRELSRLLVADQLKGNITCIDSDYFPISRWALGETVGTRKSKGDINYLIGYKIKGDDTPLSMVLTDNEIRSYLPNVKGLISTAFATMAVAMHLNAEESTAPLTVLTNYTVSDVTRVEAEQPSETTEEAPKGDDTSGQTSEADKASESVEEVKPVEPAPVVVKTESKPVRTRAASAKSPAKKPAKEKVSA